MPGKLSPEEGAILISIAREAIDLAVSRRGDRSADVRRSPPAGAGEFLDAKRGAFVTLRKHDGTLRGCIGIPYPIKPLREAVFEAAAGAATRDPRFPMVEEGEIDELTVEVSALTEPRAIGCKPLELPRHVAVGVDGLIVAGMGTSGLLLPQVASELSLTAEGFLSLTCEKAGLFPDAWLDERVRVLKFQAEVFAEGAPRGAVHPSRAFA
jgi:uncharacterized protein (TIGR00296 family)